MHVSRYAFCGYRRTINWRYLKKQKNNKKYNLGFSVFKALLKSDIFISLYFFSFLFISSFFVYLKASISFRLYSLWERT